MILTDDLVSFEDRALHEKLKCYGFSLNTILRMGHGHVVAIFQRYTKDLEVQSDWPPYTNLCFSLSNLLAALLTAG